MKYYTLNRSISPKARAILLRILFVIIAAAVITFGTIILGQYLLRKVEAAGQRPSDLAGAGWQPEKRAMDPEYTAGTAPHIRACGISRTDYPTADVLDPVLQELTVLYDTVLFPLSGSDGSLIYQSPAVCALTRIPVTDTASSDRLREAILSSKSRGFRVVVSLFPSEAVTDAALFAELASWGADEILVTPNFSGTIDYESANRLRLYLNECAAELDPACRLGTVLPASCYLDPAGTMQLQMIAQSSSTLGIRFDVQYMDPDSDVYENVYNALQSLLGSFSVYNMRVYIDGSPAAVEAQYRACADRGIMNFIFAEKTDYGAFTRPEEEPPEEEPETTVYRPEQPAGVINPYASTGETYENDSGENAAQEGGWNEWNNDWNAGNTWDVGNEWNADNTWDNGDNEWNADNTWDDGGNEWNADNTWDAGNEWNAENTWDNGGNEWNAGNTWDNGGNEWNAGNTWDNGGNEWNADNTWDNGGNEWNAGTEDDWWNYPDDSSATWEVNP